MGSSPHEEGSYDDERPRHEVSVASSYRMAVVPVTVAQYRAFEPDHRPYFEGKVPDTELPAHPVETVTWYQAYAFCRWLSASLPWLRGVRMATEEEWEHACRAGMKSRYWSGDEDGDLDRVGWYVENSDGRTHRVGEKEANPWGLYDVHGNVWEWTLSDWTDDYAGRESGVRVDPAKVDPTVFASRAADLTGGSGALRVYRGGSFGSGTRNLRCACRDGDVPGVEGQDLGFRLCLPGAPS